MNKIFLVLGGRSGTSIVAKGLHENGVVMGQDFLFPDKYNPHGYFEDIAFLTANEAYIRHGKEALPAIKSLIQKKNKQKKWGIKDPRLAFTGDIYLNELKNEDVFIIGCFRKSEQIAKSLANIPEHELDYKTALRDTKRMQHRMLKLIKKFIGYNENEFNSNGDGSRSRNQRDRGESIPHYYQRH